MPRQVVILHGWSDDSDSFRPLSRFLKRNGFQTVPVFLGDYVSLRDDVRIEDVAKRMEEAIRSAQRRSRNRLGATFDLIVHSTGGLVARQWIASNYQDSACPVQNLVMLAPANFGSALAHLGRSMLGRVLKGWKTGFETGEEMLYALELGSPFQWHLAQQDLFVPEGRTARNTPAFYGADKVRPFVLVGTYPYQDFAARITNENGSDGTVRVAAANLNSQGMTVDFSDGARALQNPTITQWRKRGGANVRFPLAVLADRTHGDVTRPAEKGGSSIPDLQKQLGELILQALRTTSATYARVADDWQQISMRTRALAGDSNERRRLFGKKSDADYYHEYFQLVVRAEDEFGTPIPDYFVRFVKKPRARLFRPLSNLEKSSVYFQDEVLEHVHVHRRSPEYRNFYMDRYDLMKTGGWYDRIKNPAERKLQFTVTAADPGERIAYFEHRPNARGLVHLHQEQQEDRWLKRHTTHFIRLIIPRASDPKIFRLQQG